MLVLAPYYWQFEGQWGGDESDDIASLLRNNGFQVLGESKWLLADTNFATQMREMKKVNADVVAISAHPFSLCGALKEMQRQGVKPKVLIGLTSSSSMETLEGCGK